MCLPVSDSLIMGAASNLKLAVIAAVVLAFSTTVQLAAQCTSCPSNNGCGGTGSGYECAFPRGSDPTCTFSDPDPCRYPSGQGCGGQSRFDGQCCERTTSPIIIDVDGDGYHLSDAAKGVWFKPFPDVTAFYKVPWPTRESHNGWLVLDRNGNGKIDDFGEFFGNETPQPTTDISERNGFAALAVYDQREEGGNNDGWISKDDSIYEKLRVWQDDNHDGISQPEELHTLRSLGIAAISLHYSTSRRVDANGNIFRFRSAIRDATGGEATKVIYDVFLPLGAERAASIASNWPRQAPASGFMPVDDAVKQ